MGVHGFLDTRGVFTTIDDPNAVPGETIAYGINDWGQVVGSFLDSAGNVDGFVDTNGHFTTFDPPGSVITYSEAITDAGQILGYYYDAAGNFNEFLATPNIWPLALSANSQLSAAVVPEPSTWAMMLLGFGLLGFAGCRRLKRSGAALAD